MHEALKAADSLDENGIRARVIDCYSVKPIDAAVLVDAAEEPPVVTAEDHWPEGGLGEAVLSLSRRERRSGTGRPPRRDRDASLGET